MSRLNGKFALITGGTNGIGLATAQLFEREGARVAITGRDPARLDLAAKTLKAEVLRADSKSVDDLDEMFAQIKDRWGKLDILIICAGITKLGLLLDADAAFIDETIDINIKGALFSVQKAVPLIPKGSSIVFITSAGNQMGVANSGIFSASKAALRSIVRVLAAELIDREIRVNAVSPGPVNTPFYTEPHEWQVMAEKIKQAVPIH